MRLLRASLALAPLLTAALPRTAHAVPTDTQAAPAPGTAVAPRQPAVALSDGAAAGSSGVVVPVTDAAARAPTDVPWVEVRVPYRGGPIPPGVQVEYQRNMPLLGGGAAAFGLGYALSIYGAFARPVALIPIVGPFIAAGQAFGTPLMNGGTDTTGGVIGLMSGVLQVAGVGAFIAGVLLPRRALVYDVPANSPAAQHAMPRFGFAPGAPGASLGASLSVTHF